MNEIVKLKCETTFHDLKENHLVRQDDVIERLSDRAAVLVAGGFCSVISRRENIQLGDDSSTNTEVIEPKKKEVVIEKKAEAKPIKKPVAKPTAKKEVKPATKKVVKK